MFHVDRWTDRHDKAVSFCNFANVPKNDKKHMTGFQAVWGGAENLTLTGI
jgi:hypothetical protein